MRIKLDEKHWLNSDAFCYWITCEYEVEKGKSAGTIAERRVSGYAATFEQAVESFIERKIKGAESESFSELVKVVNDLKAEVRSWKVDVEELRKLKVKNA